MEHTKVLNLQKSFTNLFTSELAARYDQANASLAPISEGLHFTISLVLESLPSKAKVLCAGAGTGAEILYLAKAFPNWSFVAADPSPDMLAVCRKNIEVAGFLPRCEFFDGFVEDLPAQADFDATLAVLVGHFIKREDRVGFYRSLTDRLKSGGFLINAEISYDFDSVQFPSMLKCWESVCKRMGAPPESLAGLPKQLRETLTVLPLQEVERLLIETGIHRPILFYQAFLISAWFGVK